MDASEDACGNGPAMSASEKLKALGPRALDALEELSGDAGWAHAYQPGGDDAPDREPEVRVILGALPQIVAVVEAAERYRNSRSEYVIQYAGEIPRYTQREKAGVDFDTALAALEEVLS